jgi:hypothetical protein
LNVTPSTRQRLRFLGTLFVVASGFCLVPPAVGAAAAAPAGLDLGRFFRRAFHLDVAAAAPASPQPEASSRPRRRPFLGAGSIDLSGAGSGNLGYHRTTTPDGATQQRGFGSDLTLSVARRTEQTSLSITQSIARNVGTTSLGQLAFGYRTPLYGLLYGSLAGPADTQLGIGGFARGVSLAIPRRNGELDFFGATAQGSDNQTFRVRGIRRTVDLHRGRFLSATLVDAGGELSSARSRIADLSFGEYAASRTARVEAALNTTRGVQGVADGARAAVAARVDFRSANGFESLSFANVPVGFAPVGLVQNGDRVLEFSTGRRFGAAQSQLDLARDRATDQTGGVTDATRMDLGVSFPLRVLGALNANAAVGRVHSTGGDTRSSTFTVGATQSPHGFALAETYGRSTVGGGISQSSYTQYAVAASHALGGGFLAGQGSYQASDAEGRATVLGGQLNFTRSLNPRNDLDLRVGLQRVNSAGQIATIRSLGATYTRHLSRALALRIDASRTAQTGPGGGTGSSLDVELVGPLSFGGTARYAGRANPNLPAIVQGRIIYQDIGLNASGGPLSSRGVAGVIVVLDGIQTQRTDSDGSYQFRFVKPGEHTVALQDGTIPLGLVAERDARQFSVQGGQIVVTDFLVGQYGGVRGKVTSAAAGGPAPLSGVAILVDGTQRVFTGPDGSFQLGKLATGAHTVQLVNDSLPASAQIAGAATRTVQVRQGALTSLEFSTLRLGSLRGTVYDGDPLKGAGAPDIYVVAQPGDHAAITGADGTFIIDNLTPGHYTLAIDPQTLPDGAAVQSGDGQAKDVGPGEDVADLVFSVGAAAKDVVFDFSDKKRAALQLTLDPLRVPPLGEVELRVATTAPRDAKLEASVGLSKIPLRFISNGVFGTRVVVPAGSPPGDVPVHVEVAGSTKGSADALFTVDPKVPLVTIRIQETRVIPGQTVHGVLKTYADVRAGDAIVFADGQQVRLSEPHGRVYGFNVRIGPSGLPMRGTLTTRGGEHLAITIDRSHGDGGSRK